MTSTKSKIIVTVSSAAKSKSSSSTTKASLGTSVISSSMILRSWFSKLWFVVRIHVLISTCCVTEPEVLHIRQTLGFIGSPVLDDVDILHGSKLYKLGLEILLSQVPGNHEEQSQSIDIISTVASSLGTGNHYLQWSGIISNTLTIHLLKSV